MSEQPQANQSEYLVTVHTIIKKSDIDYVYVFKKYIMGPETYDIYAHLKNEKDVVLVTDLNYGQISQHIQTIANQITGV